MTDTTTLTGPTPAARTATVSRTTSESDITVTINLDGSGKSNINTGVPFFDHMLTAFCVHGAFDLKVHAQGDTHIDAHHTVEDVAIVLGQALAEAVGDKQGIRRFGSFSVPMDEALCEAVVDFSGRPYYVVRGGPEPLPPLRDWRPLRHRYQRTFFRIIGDECARHPACDLPLWS